MADLPNALSLAGALALLFTGLLTEVIVTGRQYRRMIREKDEAIAEWRTVAHTTQAQVSKLLADDKLEHALLQSLVGESNRRAEPGGG